MAVAAVAIQLAMTRVLPGFAALVPQVAPAGRGHRRQPGWPWRSRRTCFALDEFDDAVAMIRGPGTKVARHIETRGGTRRPVRI